MQKSTLRGFTLIELLVVIAIIGILSSVVLASLNDARQKSRDAKRIADIKQLQLAQELYYDSNGSYAPALADLATGGFIAAVPTDPVNNAAYFYEALSSNTDYNLGADLEDMGHSALDADIDTGAGGTISAADTAGCAATNPPTTRACYNVKP